MHNKKVHGHSCLEMWFAPYIFFFRIKETLKNFTDQCRCRSATPVFCFILPEFSGLKESDARLLNSTFILAGNYRYIITRR